MLCGTKSWIELWSTFSVFFVDTAKATVNVNAATAPVVDLGYAQYQGFVDTRANITKFLGIRYAAPPLGNLRFQAPQAPAPDSGLQFATQNPDMCYQAGSGTNTTASVSSYEHRKRELAPTPPASEDCLFLNVFVPGTLSAELVAKDGLPVLVWIHGGGYEYGYAAEYNGADLVIDSMKTVVVVVIQYRLGAFGFLSGSNVKAQGALNAGLLDQAFALQWVQDNIGSFGGDKDHVTIWGESAGAGSVLQHIVANGGNTQPPLFKAAITSSTFLPSQYNYNDLVPQALYNQIVSLTGCESSIDTFTCLQSVDAETLQAANPEVAASVFYGTFAFVPVIDGTLIVERPSVTLSKGHVNGQVFLAFTNQHEGNTFVDANESLTITEYISVLFPKMTPSEVQDAANVYADCGTALEQAIMVMGDSIFVCPSYYLLEAFAGRSWKGLFAIPPAYHALDLVYYFRSRSDPPPYNNTEFITAFSQSFMSLAKSYDVNAKLDPDSITPQWDMYIAGDVEMLFNQTEAGQPVVRPIRTDPAVLERCAFWSTVTSNTAQ